MKIKLSKKTKTFLWVVTALTTSTAVTTVLTSCSVANQNIINDIGGYDKEYGINDVTYARMEEDFKTLYKSQLDEKLDVGDITDDIYNSSLYTFKNNLNCVHTSLYSDENKTLSYTIKTNVLRDYARNNYGIRLTRQSNVSLPVAISGIKGSIINSILLLCKEYKITDTDTNKYRENAEAEFEKLYTEAKSKYAKDDVVSIVQYIQNGMLSCFANFNKELDVLITQQQLKDFINKYQISVREDITENYYWDKLSSIYSEPNKEISTEDFNDIFEITYEDSDPQSSNGSYFSSSKKTVEFNNDMITGYTLKPILAKINGDPYTNVYSIDIDYTLVNNNYKDAEKVAELTAHSSALKDKSFYEDENISIFDLNANESEREYTNYILPITKGYEEEQINKTYFNNQDFKFTWSTSEEYGYDDFWAQPNENDEYKATLDTFGLATTGMMINGYLLSELLEKDESDKMPDAFNNAVRLVKNTDFSFNFTENDYEVVKDDNKLGEIEVNNFTINYKNSKNKFNLLEENKDIIEKAINEDSGITTRTSLKFWEHIKTNYDDANSALGKIDDLSNKLSDVNGHVNGLIISSLTLYSIVSAIALVLTMYMVINSIRGNFYKDVDVGYFVFCFLLFAAPIIPIANTASEKISKFSEYLESIKSEKDSQFIVNINSDKKYFYNNKGEEDKSKFDKLTLDEKRKLKIYYSTYKNKETEEDKKTQSQKDYEQFLMFDKNKEENKENLYSYLDDFKTFVWILADIWAVVGILLETALYVVFMNSAKKLDGHQWQLQIGAIVASILSVVATVITIVYTL